MEILTLVFGAIFVNNFILSRFLGICPFIGVSKKIETSLGMGAAVTFVMIVSSAVTWMINHWVLIPFEMGYLSTIAFIVVIASLVQFIEMFLKKYVPTLYSTLGVFLPLITTNCAILALSVMNMDNNYSFFMSVVHAVGAGIGFTLAIVLFGSIRERLDRSDILPHFRGVPIALLTAGLMAIAFMGFTGMI